MPVCEGCGSSYDDNCKLCPNCGRSNPKQEPVPVRRQICYLDKRSRIVDRNHAETWWEAVCEGKVIAKTGALEFQYDEKDHKFKSNLNEREDEDCIRPKDLDVWGMMNQVMDSEYRALIFRLLADGWEIMGDQSGQVKMMQRVKS
jgi:hypothetical protein